MKFTCRYIQDILYCNSQLIHCKFSVGCDLWFNIPVDVLSTDTTVDHSFAAKSRQPVCGRKVVITTGRLPRHEGSRPSTLPPRARQTSNRRCGRSRRGCGGRQQVVTAPVTNIDDDDESEVEDAEKTLQESTAGRCARLTSMAPRRTTERDEQMNSGTVLLHFILSCLDDAYN